MADILIVTEDLIARAVLEDSLQQTPHERYFFDTPEETEQYLQRHDAQLVIADMNHMDLITRLVRNLPNIGTILMGAECEESLRRHAEAIGADAYLRKPLNVSVIRNTVRAMFP